MAVVEPRSAAERKADTLAKLRTPALDAWVTSASVAEDGSPRAHVVPLSLVWLDERAVIAVAADSVTARNVRNHGRARIAIGPTRDVVVIDAVLQHSVDVTDAPELADAYAGQADWDPRTASGKWVYIVLRPVRIQAWRESNELAGRTLMRDGAWLV